MNTKIIGEIVAREIRIAGMARESQPLLPLPSDIDCESECVSAVLSGDVLAGDLAPLAPEHFYADILRAIWTAALDAPPGDVVTVKQRLQASGWLGAVGNELIPLTTAQPFRSLPRLKAQAARLVELSRQRRLIDTMQRLDVELRVGLLDLARAGTRLREVLA